MPVHCLHDKSQLRDFLSQNPGLHIYSLGDLDEFYWPYTQWFALRPDSQSPIQALVLQYSGQELPCVLAFGDKLNALADLFSQLPKLLPSRYYAHMSAGLKELLPESWSGQSKGLYHKMLWTDKTRGLRVDAGSATPLTAKHRSAIDQLYKDSYPGHWFDPRMLATGQYFGIWRGSQLAAIAGIHVYSPEYGVAALGNITCHPKHRGQGLGQAVTARLCQSLAQSVEVVGLNVKAGNTPAIRCYQSLGFEIIADYEEVMVSANI